MPDRRLTATYRLQLHSGFTFADAKRIVPYLADLGVSHLYLSPILQAAPDSMHGYDVVDHTSVSADLGGRAALESLADHAHSHDLGLICDVVPNHMAIPAPEHLNNRLWDVLRSGQHAESADWFDIDWELCGGRLGLPLLGETLDKTLAAGEITLGAHDGEPVLRYHDHVFPIAPGSTAGGTSDPGGVADVLSRQHYQLASWREKDAVLGYRRFFDVDTLIAVRVEDPAVFDATHALLLELHANGVFDGFRIDHPDGLADPEGYLARLRDATGDGWVVVEKILEGDERLQPGWATAGTTGYDALNVIQTALAPPQADRLDSLWKEVGGSESLAEAESASKRQVATTLLAPEVERLTRLATGLSEVEGAIALPTSDNSVCEALVELLTHVEVYRAYLRPGRPADGEALGRLGRMVDGAKQSRPDLARALDWLHERLVDVDTTSPANRDLIVRFQQVCGPVMAKGVEDTTFYRWNRLIALNEVGGDPAALDRRGPERLHAWAQHQQRSYPTGMTTLSTHDTKRSEDARARLLALAADPDAWESTWALVWARAERQGVDGPTAYLLFQTLIGAWPIDEQRLTDYVVKAAREAKRYTTWDSPDETYEENLVSLARTCLGDESFRDRVVETLIRSETTIRNVTLAAKLVQLTLPGVPDVYQGCESIALAVVDPDNRRPVDYAELSARLARVDDGPAAAGETLDDAKLRVTSRALRLRRYRPELFGAPSVYQQLPSSPGLLAFGRVDSEGAAATVVRTGADAGDETVTVPHGRWRDVLSDNVHDGGTLSARDVLATMPVALLVREDQ